VNVSNIPAPRARRRKGAAAPAVQSAAALYLRVSTEGQSEDGGSLESQEQRCRDLCRARGYDVARAFIDAGQSGGSLDRPALTELRESVAAGEVGVVVVYALDRLSRSQRDTLALLEEFEDAGAGLTAASQSFDTTTPAGRAMLGMLAVFAELQRAEIRERTRSALAAKKARGEAVGRAPFGLRREGAGYVRDQATWPIVARILSQRSSGASCQSIADTLNADGVATATATHGDARGKAQGSGKWHAATVAKLCRSPYVLAAAES
jgi:site-specific DNA recombinase